MKTQYQGIAEMAKELERRMAAKQDYLLDTRKMEMTGHGELALAEMPGTVPALAVNEIAHDQIGERVGIPAKYYNRMLASAPGLLAQNVNHWFGSKPERRMIRTLDGKVRAFLSDRYQRIENEQIANQILPILLEDESVRIESCAITETRMYIKAVFPKIQGEVTKGDIVQSGISISNSEVGRGMVKIEPLIFRLVCTNGLVLPDNRFSMRHVGGKIENNEGIYEMLSDEAIEADDKAIMLKVRDVVRASFDEVRFGESIAKLRDSRNDKLECGPVAAVKFLSKKQSLTEFESGSVLRHLIDGGDTSRYGFLNAVTRTAQDVESYDRSHELETLGGEILTMPKAAWRELALAA